MNDIKVGQKLYHFAYGPLTVISDKGRYVDTVDDIPSGFRQKNYTKANRQTWIKASIGHWLFESPEDVGKENNNWNWKEEWPKANCGEEGPLCPARSTAKDKDNWHRWYFDQGYADISDIFDTGKNAEGYDTTTGGITDDVTDNMAFTNKAGGITDDMNMPSVNRAGGITDDMNMSSVNRAGGITDDMNMPSVNRAGGITDDTPLMNRAGGITDDMPSRNKKARHNATSRTGKTGGITDDSTD